MAKPNKNVTPADRVDRWKKLWGTPKRLSVEETDSAFEEFEEGLIPSHMRKQFLRLFGLPKAQFGNRYFPDDAQYRDWNMKLASLLGEGDPVEVVVIYGSPDSLEAHLLRGERRLTLRDIVIDDWQAACAVVKAGETTLFVFVEPKMKGCIVRSTHLDDA